MPNKLMQIGEVAGRVGLSLRTVRHYEEVGLVLPVARTQGNFRLYDDDAIARLLLIKQMKPLDFTLEEMADLLALRARLHADLDEEERAAVTERLEMYLVAARQRCLALREQLDVAEAFLRSVGNDLEPEPASPPPRLLPPGS